MPIDWPPALVTELAERRCIVFMGAGVSMGSIGEDGSTHPPSWEKFLKDALKLIPDATDRKSAQVSINKYQYLDAAEIILAWIIH